MPEVQAPEETVQENTDAPQITPENNPLEIIKRIRSMGILGLVLPDDAVISERKQMFPFSLQTEICRKAWEI